MPRHFLQVLFAVRRFCYERGGGRQHDCCQVHDRHGAGGLRLYGYAAFSGFHRTLAGEDTILIICKTDEIAEEKQNELRKLIGGG